MASAITFGRNVLGRKPTAPPSSAARIRSSSSLAEIIAMRAFGTCSRKRNSASRPEQPGVLLPAVTEVTPRKSSQYTARRQFVFSKREA